MKSSLTKLSEQRDKTKVVEGLLQDAGNEASELTSHKALADLQARCLHLLYQQWPLLDPKDPTVISNPPTDIRHAHQAMSWDYHV